MVNTDSTRLEAFLLIGKMFIDEDGRNLPGSDYA